MSEQVPDAEVVREKTLSEGTPGNDAAVEELQECACPDTYPDWDGKTLDLGGSCIHEMKIASFFHMPVAYDMYVSKQAANIHHLGLVEKWPRFVLTKTGMWGGKIICLVEDSSSPSRLVNFIPGSFWVKAQMHHGGIGSIHKVVHKMQIAMIEEGCMPKEFYLAHLTCSFCVERKGGEDKILIVRRFVPNKRIQERLRKEAEKNAAKESKLAVEQAGKQPAEV